jgi:hypothetical protein
LPKLPRLRIPPSQVQPLEALRTLSDSDFERLLAVLRDLDGPVPDAEVLIERATTAFPDIDAEPIVDMLFVMERLREDRRETADLTATALANASGLTLNPEERTETARRLERALSSPALRLASKATDVLYANERNIDSFRIVTELRPLFLDDPSVKPTTAVLAHRLEVEFFGQGGRTETLDFGLDAEDLQHLYEAVTRAQAKAQTMTELARAAGLRVPAAGGSDES